MQIRWLANLRGATLTGIDLDLTKGCDVTGRLPGCEYPRVAVLSLRTTAAGVVLLATDAPEAVLEGCE